MKQSYGRDLRAVLIYLYLKIPVRNCLYGLPEPLPFDEPEAIQPEDIGVNKEEIVLGKINTETNDDGQVTLSLN